MNHYPNILLVAGTGRNSGKTTLAVKIIQKFAGRSDLTAIKISPHFHKGANGLVAMVSSDKFNIYLERTMDGVKDSSKMLAAGASRAYYIEVHDQHLQDAFTSLLDKIPPSSPVVVESPALGRIISPGVYFIVDHPQTLNKKKELLATTSMADKFINSEIEDLDQLLSQLTLDDQGWHFSS